MYKQSLEYFSKEELIAFIKENFSEREVEYMEETLSEKKLKQLEWDFNKYNKTIPYIEEELSKCRYDFQKELTRNKLISYRKERDRLKAEIDKFEL